MLNSIKKFSIIESLLLFIATGARKVTSCCQPNLLSAKSVFDQLLISGHKVIKEGSINQIKYMSPASDKMILFYVRRGTTDAVIFNEIVCRRDYRFLLSIQQKINCEILSIVDAGANIGSSTVYFKTVFPAATIISIEPEENNFEMLKKNILMNKFEDVHCIKAGLWNKDCFLEIKEGFRGNKERELSFYVSEVPENTHVKKIKGITLKSIREQFLLPSIDILKIDIEGAERFLFSGIGATENILEHVKILAIEVHEEVMDKFLLVDYLEQLGYHQITFGEILYAYKI